jgi:quercetin dioxygenase-like cupin family protein
MSATLSKQERDSQANSQLDDVYVDVGSMPWVPFSEGIEIKVLRVSSESGAWTSLFRCQPGSGFARHRHLGPAEYLMVSGKMEVRGGRENGGITALAGDYGYEPLGAIHDWTSFPEDTVFYFTQNGPLEFLTDEDETAFILDWRNIEQLRKTAENEPVSA